MNDRFKASMPNLINRSSPCVKEVLTCGLSCLNALNAVFARLVAIVVASRGRRGNGGGKGNWAPPEDRIS